MSLEKAGPAGGKDGIDLLVVELTQGGCQLFQLIGTILYSSTSPQAMPGDCRAALSSLSPDALVTAGDHGKNVRRPGIQGVPGGDPPPRSTSAKIPSLGIIQSPA